MIRSLVIPGGGYGDCLPSGQYAVPQGPTRVVTSEGPLTTAFDPRWLSLSPDGHAWAAQCGAGTELVPGSTDNYGGVEYFVSDRKWRDITDAAGRRLVVGGMNPVIYTNDNQLRVHPVGPGMPVEGYRSVDENNRLIESIDTQAPGPIAPRITQWFAIKVGDRTLVVGQGDRGGAALFDGTTYRSLIDPENPDVLPADAFVVGIKFRIAGSQLAFHVHLPKLDRTVLLWMDVADLDDLPLYTAVVEAAVPEAIAPNVPSVSFTGFWRANSSAPGNAAIDNASSRAVIADESKILSVPKERRLGLLVYVDGSDAEAIATLKRGAQFAAENDLVIFVYDDQRAFRYGLVRQQLAGRRFVLMPQWYLRANAALVDAGETPAEFAADVIAQAKSFDGCYLMPTIRATFGGWLIPAADVVEALNELVQQGAMQLPNFLGWLFWAWSRADGANPLGFVDKNGDPIPIPAFRPAIDVWMQTPTTVTDAPAWIAQAFKPKPEPLSVTITKYTELGISPVTVEVDCETSGVPGPGFKVQAFIDGLVVAEVPAAGKVRLSFPLTEPGVSLLKARVTDGVRMAETGATRFVRVNPSPTPEIPGITFPSQPGSGTVEGARKPFEEAAAAARREENQ